MAANGTFITGLLIFPRQRNLKKPAKKAHAKKIALRNSSKGEGTNKFPLVVRKRW